ncbi:MAG TPA: hypothetical protein VG936_08815 [Lacunisphaera sp.]|nr:hypothetical protein [Lacunisphaera sp.]
MSASPKIAPAALIVAVLMAGSLLAWTNLRRAQRIGYVTSLAQPAGQAPAVDAGSPTGYVRGQRNLIVPERDEATFALIAETQQMFATGRWRIRHVDFDNAPAGREERSTSPARWWLGLNAWAVHLATGQPIGPAAERAALLSEPVLHALAWVAFTAWIAWQFGWWPATLASLGLICFFPFGAGFLPGVPGTAGLSRVCILAALLSLLTGLLGRSLRRRWFALAGVAGGIGLWVDVAGQLPVLAGIAAGGLLAAWFERTAADHNVIDRPAWRAWSLAGGITVVIAYLVEFAPSHLGTWQLDTIHPLYGLAWIAVGEIVARVTAATRRNRIQNAGGLFVLFAAAALAATPLVLMWTGNSVLGTHDLAALRLTNQPDGPLAPLLWAWLHRDGLSTVVCATLLPVIGVLPAAWLLLRRPSAPAHRAAVAVTLMPTVVALGMATGQLAWWATVDALLLVLVVAVTAGMFSCAGTWARRSWGAAVVLAVAVGFFALRPTGDVGPELKLTPSETQELVERDLAHWLARHAGDERPIVFAPPRESLTLSFYGGLRGIGTNLAGNEAGFGATLALAGAQTMEEVEAQIQLQGVRYLVVPSWDPFFDEFGHLYLQASYAKRQSLFIGELRRWHLPAWLAPLAYPMPVIGGFERQSVQVFEVVDPQNPAAAAARLAEYLVETGDVGAAETVSGRLSRFPGDLGALAARAQVQLAHDDGAGFKDSVDLLVARVSDGADRFMPWDRRVSLAIVLAQGNRLELARVQVQRCLAEVSEQKLRRLTPGSLYRLLVLARAFNLELNEPQLRALALDLVPAELRSKI